jgi:hypothetical protein
VNSSDYTDRIGGLQLCRSKTPPLLFKISKYYYLLGGLIIGAFGAGLALKAQYDNLSHSYTAIMALQEDKWGTQVIDQYVSEAGGNATTECPDGSYMVGLKTKAAAGGIGGLTPICRHLKLK